MKERWDTPQFFYYYNLQKTKYVETFHYHRYMEIVYFHAANGQLMINGKTYKLQGEAALAIFLPYQLHQVQFQVPYARTVLGIHQPAPPAMSHLFPETSEFLSQLLNRKMEHQLFYIDNDTEHKLMEPCEAFHRALSENPTLETDEHFLIFWLQFLTLFKHVIQPQWAEDRTFATGKNAHMEKVIAWIESHFHQPFDLNYLAAQIHISPNYLSNLFREYNGITLSEYIVRRRLDEARVLLRATSRPIQDIAQAVGFQNISYFCRSFKKRSGMTPLKYRISSYCEPGTQ